MKNQKSLYSLDVLINPMTELERIAKEFPHLFYSGVDRTKDCEEFLAYDDDWSTITASTNNRFRRDPKTVVYIICHNLDSYLRNLKDTKNKLAKRIVEAIEETGLKPAEFVKDFGVDNFDDLPAIIRVHEELRDTFQRA